MKKIAIILASALLLAATAECSARGLITGDKSMELSFAVTDFRGASAELRYAALIRPRMEIGFSLSVLGLKYKKDEYEIPLIQGGVAFDFSHILISAKRSTLALWADLHLYLGYESVNMGKSHLDDGAELLSGSCLLWGGMAALRLEIPISSKCAISIRARGRYMPPSNVSQLHAETGIGLRIRL